MRAPVLAVVADLHGPFFVLLEMRVSLERARARVDELHLEAEDAGLENHA